MDRCAQLREAVREGLSLSAGAIHLAEQPAESSKPKRFAGLAYSGAPVAIWGEQFIIELSSLRFPERVGVLVDHDSGQRAGFGRLSLGDDGLRIEGQFLGTDLGTQVATELADGFPWEMSVRVSAYRTERLEVGAESVVNGQTIQGPALIAREGTIDEVSFTAIGRDRNTSAESALSGTNQSGHEEDSMTDHAHRVGELEAQLSAQTTKTTEAEAARDAALAQVEDLEAKLAAAEARADQAVASLATIRAEQRDAAVTQLLSDVGREITDETKARYLAMDDETFAAVSTELRAVAKVKPGKSADPALFKETATAGTPGGAELSPEAQGAAIAAEATKRVAAAKKDGTKLSVSDAVSQIMNERKEAA